MLSGRPGGPQLADQQQNWIPILDYAVLKGVSTSTLRRYIKAKKIPYKIENGRYLLLADSTTTVQINNPPLKWDNATTHEGVSLFGRVHELEEKLMRAQEQISELKMLVAIYEEKLSQTDH